MSMLVLGLPLWLLAIDTIAVIIMFILLLAGNRLGSLITLVAIACSYFFFSNNGINPFAWAWEYPDKVFEGLGVYVLFGIVWGAARWYFYFHSDETAYVVKSAHDRWEDNANRLKALGSTVAEFKDSSYYPFGWRQDSNRIATWIVFWPLSIVWYFLHTVIVNLWDHVWNFIKWVGQSFSGLYASIASSQVDRILKDKK